MTIPTLQTAQLLLRPFTLDDAPVVQQLAGAHEVASTTLNIPHPYEDGMAEVWIASHEAAWDAKEVITLATTTEGDGVVVTVTLHINSRHRRGELGHWLGLPYWNRGYATEASAALLRLGFDVLDLNRIQARHITRNPASGRVMQKLGMEFEGISRQHMLMRGEFEDVTVYAILSSDRPQP
jgi:RimJ/RimL family protein N-acetyltransferase